MILPMGVERSGAIRSLRRIHFGAFVWRVSLGRGRDQLWGSRSCGIRRLWRCADYELKEQKSQGKTIDPHAPRLASVRNDTPGAGTYDPQDTKKKAPSANFGKSKAVDLPFRGASTDAIYYPDEQHANSHPSAAFTSNEPRLLPPRQAGPGEPFGRLACVARLGRGLESDSPHGS